MHSPSSYISRILTTTDTKLADRTTSLENHNNHNPKRPIETPSTTAPPNAGDNKAKTTSTETALLLTRLRRDLADAQRSKAELDGRLKTCTEELERIKRISQTNSRRVEELSVERATLIRAVKDRDEELKEKAKLFQVCTYLHTYITYIRAYIHIYSVNLTPFKGVLDFIVLCRLCVQG